MTYKQTTDAAISIIKKPSPAESKQQHLHSIFYRNLASLEGTAYDAYTELRSEDAQRIMRHLREEIARYTGKPSSFLKFARSFIRKQVQWYRYGPTSLHYQSRSEFLESIMRDRKAKGAIFNGIRDGLSGVSMDCAIDAEDVFQEVLFLIWKMADDLSKPSSSANLATRLRALAKRHTLGYHTLKRNRRYNSLTAHLNSYGDLGCEYITDMELASMRADEFADAA